MTVDEWPEWLPADWIIQIRKIDERKVKCFIDPKGQKFYSKPQVDRHLKTSKNSTVSEKTNNGDGPNLDLSLDPEDLETNEDPESTPKGQSTRPRRTGSSSKKYKETEELLAEDGSSSVRVRDSRGRKHVDSNWLPEGWTMDEKSKKSGQKYKIYTSPNGKKLFSKPQVLSYLASPAGQKEGDKTPGKSQIEPTEAEKDETRMITESTRMSPDYEVISSTPADGLPPGWIKEIRARPHGPGKKKDPYYLDPLSGYVFFSKLDALRYLDTGDVKKCAMRPLRRDMNQDINQIGNQTEGELAITPSEPTKEPETPKALQNGNNGTESKTEGSGTEKRKVRSITGDGHLPMPISSAVPISSQKGDDWLPEGWLVEVKHRDNGLKLKCYKEIATGKNFYSKPQVMAYLGYGNSNSISKSNSGKRKKRRKSSSLALSPDSESEDEKHEKRSRKTKTDIDTSNFTETIVTSPAEGLPPGWIKEIRSRICGTNIRKDPFYTDPVSGYIFRSKLDALRYLDTGDINLCAIRPRMRDADGNEVAITDGTPKPKTRKVPIEGGSDMEAVDNSDTDPKSTENTPDSTPGSGSVRRGTRDRAAKGKTSAPLPARSSTRIKGVKPHTKTDTLDENAPQPDIEKGEAGRINVEKQSGDVEHLDYQLEDDSSWTDQFDFAVKTLVGEIPPNESGGVGNGSPAKVN